MIPADEPRCVGTIWALGLDGVTRSVVALVPATFARVGPDGTSRLAAAMRLGDPVEVRRRFDAGRRCYAAWVAGEIAAYGWVSFDQEAVGELGLTVRLLPGDAYVWDCATVVAFRRRRLYTALLAHIVAVLRAEGLSRVWIGADTDNASSQAGIALAGFQPVADLLVARAQTAGRFSVHGRPGIPEGLLAEARSTFLGDRP